MINEDVSLELHFSFKKIQESDIQKEVSTLNSKKVGPFGNSPTKVLKDSSNICNSLLQNIWNYEILRKQYFPKNLKLSDITPVYKKKDPTLVENYQPASIFPCVSKVFNSIIQRQFSSFIDEFLSPYLCGYRKGFMPNILFFHLLRNGRKFLMVKGILGQC